MSDEWLREAAEDILWCHRFGRAANIRPAPNGRWDVSFRLGGYARRYRLTLSQLHKVARWVLA